MPRRPFHGRALDSLRIYEDEPVQVSGCASPTNKLHQTEMTKMTTTIARPIGLHERYAVARRFIDSASLVAVAAILHLDAPKTSPIDYSLSFEALNSHLERRIDLLLPQYPLLGHCIRNARSRTPSFTPVTPAPTAKDILFVGTKLDETVEDEAKLLSQVLLAEQNALKSELDIEKGPLWRVRLHPIDQARCLVVLATDHVINDGKGTLNLFSMLLQSSDPAVKVGENVPQASDKVFNFKPSTRYMLGVVWKELILPKLPLPSKLKARLCGPASWPAEPSPASGSRKRKAEHALGLDSTKSPKKCAPVLDVMLFSAPNLITNLKKLAKANIDPTSKAKKAATLHAIIHTLVLVSLYAAISPSSNAELVLETGTPISLREEAPPLKRRRNRSTTLPLEPAVESSGAAELPVTTGNFVSNYNALFRIRPNDTFWHFTNRFATSFSSPSGRKLAKQHMGMLAYIPDFESEPSLEKGEMYRNGWEKFFGEKINSASPFDSALTLSNLGMMDTSMLSVEGWKVREVSWAQSKGPRGEAFGVDVVGFGDVGGEQKLSLALSSRPEAFADKELHQRFERYLRRLMLAFAADDVGRLENGGKVSQESGVVGPDLRSDPTFASLAKYLALNEEA